MNHKVRYTLLGLTFCISVLSGLNAQDMYDPEEISEIQVAPNS